MESVLPGWLSPRSLHRSPLGPIERILYTSREIVHLLCEAFRVKSMIRKLTKHLRNRTLIEAIVSRIRRRMRPKRINRFNVSNKAEASVLLANLASEQANKSAKTGVLVVGDAGDYTAMLIEAIEKKGLYAQRMSIGDLLNHGLVGRADDFGCIAAGVLDSRSLTAIGRKVTGDKALSKIPFEYIVIPGDEYQYLKHMDYISPLLLSEIDIFDIYKDSLKRFEAKCEFRDFMDLFQLLTWIVDSAIEGDVAEFGSYKGHSGYLISQTLMKLGSEKQLFMFDMFEDFPVESIGVDYFWNNSHPVEFNEVRAKFADVRNATLVKGDFTETFEEAEIGKLSLVYIDCDSYRGTSALLRTIYEKYLAPNGVVILEDYGHGPLLGNRIAFHEFFDGRTDCFKFFSHFNGFQIVVKLQA